MKFYVNDTAVILTDDPSVASDPSFVANVQGLVTPDKLHDKVLIQKLKASEYLALFASLKASSPHDHPVTSLTILVDDLQEAEREIKSHYELVEAAGGLVINDDKYLMIYRLQKWDLPKGKLEKGEDAPTGALREVEEECSVKVEMGEKICDTWHTYEREGKSFLKKTYWYTMRLIDDSNMKPQTEEDIDKVEWMDRSEIYRALHNTYPSIKEVLEEYEKMIKQA